MNALAIPIIHPAFENLKRLGGFLHFIAGLLILMNALHQLQAPSLNQLYFWCQLIIAADILVMVFTSQNIVQELPRVNLVFRLIESVIFLGAAFLLMAEKDWVMGGVLLLVSVAYAYLMYCEKKGSTVERVLIHHTGITISGIPSSRFFLWSHINGINAHYDHIVIETSFNKTYHFPFRQNLQFEELDQIHEFCRHYLKSQW
jgi:lipoprotein signal peptidase